MWDGVPLQCWIWLPVKQKLYYAAAASGAFCYQDTSATALQISKPTVDPLFMRGTLYQGPIVPPRVLWKSDRKPRKDHDASDWLTATEFQDAPDVVMCKAKQLAALMRLSQRTVIYSGAGI